MSSEARLGGLCTIGHEVRKVLWGAHRVDVRLGDSDDSHAVLLGELQVVIEVTARVNHDGYPLFLTANEIVRSASEQAGEEATLVCLRRIDLGLGVLASAPLRCGDAALHHLYVFTTTSPRRLTAGSALYCSAHPTLFLSVRAPHGYKTIYPRGYPTCQTRHREASVEPDDEAEWIPTGATAAARRLPPRWSGEN